MYSNLIWVEFNEKVKAAAGFCHRYLIKTYPTIKWTGPYGTLCGDIGHSDIYMDGIIVDTVQLMKDQPSAEDLCERHNRACYDGYTKD